MGETFWAVRVIPAQQCQCHRCDWHSDDGELGPVRQLLEHWREAHHGRPMRVWEARE